MPLGLALRTGETATVFAAEHLVECLHGWVCYCAPIRDASRRIVGVIDLSTTWDRANPLAISTANALAGLIEARLREWDRGPLQLRDNRISIRCLGAMEASRGSDELRLTPQRPEISHLRRLIGGSISGNRYALSAEISCDAVEVLSALKGGDITTAIAKYRGPLLPGRTASQCAATPGAGLPLYAGWPEPFADGADKAERYAGVEAAELGRLSAGALDSLKAAVPA